jgi:hypothetical protein
MLVAGQIEQAHNLLAEQLSRLDHSGEYHFPLLNLRWHKRVGLERSHW